LLPRQRPIGSHRTVLAKACSRHARRSKAPRAMPRRDIGKDHPAGLRYFVVFIAR